MPQGRNGMIPLAVFSTGNHCLRQTPKQAADRQGVGADCEGRRQSWFRHEGWDAFLPLLVSELNHVPQGAEGHSHVVTQAVMRSFCFGGREYQPRAKKGPLIALYKLLRVSLLPRKLKFQELLCHWTHVQWATKIHLTMFWYYLNVSPKGW